MMGKAQKSAAPNTTTRKPTGVVAQSKPREGAGNHQRANALPFPGVLQAKLTIGEAGDSFEQEADRVASEVMRMANDMGETNDTNVATMQHAASVGDRVQRQCACKGACDKCKKKQLSLKRVPGSAHGSAEVPSSVDAVLRSSGEPLDAATRSFMEPRFGYDFGQVRVHTDAPAAESAREVSALAFTVGNHIAFAGGQYRPGSASSNRLLAHELAHVVQQGGASNVIQRAGNPAFIPTGFACPIDLTTGAPAGTDLLFPTGDATVTGAHNAQLTAFVAAWAAAGGTDDIIIHGYASVPGDEGLNWTLSCQRAQHVSDALLGLGVPAVHLSILAHGESTDFGASAAPNQHAVVTSSPGGLFSPPIVFGTLTPLDDFAGRSHIRFGVDEMILLDFFSIPPASAADFGGLTWNLVSGGGTLLVNAPDGTGIYIAPDRAATVTLELRVAAGPTAGRVVATEVISIVEPSAVNMVEVPGTSPNFGGWGNPLIPAGTWGAGFQATVFVDPKDVSFQGVVFGEGTTTGVVTPAGSFISPHHGVVHPVNTFGPAHGGNAATGTAVSPPPDGIWMFGLPPTGNLFGFPTCGNGTVSTFLWAIPWEFSVAGGARRRFAGGFRARQVFTSTFFCAATAAKAGAGPFCRRIDGSVC